MAMLRKSKFPESACFYFNAFLRMFPKQSKLLFLMFVCDLLVGRTIFLASLNFSSVREFSQITKFRRQ